MKRTIFQKITLGSTVLSILWALGIHFLFHACGAKEDGTYMSCHYAELWVTGFFFVYAAMEILIFLMTSKKVRRILLAMTILVQLAVLIVPQNVIRLCMMKDMRCWRLMKPAATVGAVLFLLLSVCQWMTLRKEERPS